MAVVNRGGLVLVGALLSSACASVDGPGPRRIRVDIENNDWYDARVRLFCGHTPVGSGSAPGLATTTFYLHLSDCPDLRATVRRAGREIASGTAAIAPGGRAVLTIRPGLSRAWLATYQPL